MWSGVVLWVCYSKVRCGTVGVCSLTNKNDSRCGPVWYCGCVIVRSGVGLLGVL